MTSEMLVKLLDQGTVKLHDPLSKYAPPGARVPTYNGTPITLVNLATHTSALPREQPGARRIARYLSGQPANSAGATSLPQR